MIRLLLAAAAAGVGAAIGVASSVAGMSDDTGTQVPMCGWRSPSSDDGYCLCILPVHQGPHRCMHGWLT